MADPALYTASVPVLRHYLSQAKGLVRRATPEMLGARLAPDMFTGAEQFATAAGFALRIACPLAGRAVPEFPHLGMDGEGLRARIAFADDQLASLEPTDFAGAEDRMIAHRAGFAELEQTGADFLHLFGMPNFLFHLSMGFAVLRQSGAEVGKADFDGLHTYPHGFRF